MPACEGLPRGPCPLKKNDSTVLFSQGDLYLCQSCLKQRFSPPPETDATEPVSQQNGASPETKLQLLSDLEKYGKNDLAKVFCENMALIYQYSANDIQQVLAKQDMDALDPMRKALVDLACEAFPQLSERRPINRQIKHEILPDIFLLGYSIINKLVAKDLEKMFAPVSEKATTSAECPQDGTQDIIVVLTKLSERVSSLEKEVAAMKKENEKLKTRLSNDSPHTTDPRVNNLQNINVSSSDSDSDESDSETTVAKYIVPSATLKRIARKCKSANSVQSKAHQTPRGPSAQGSATRSQPTQDTQAANGQSIQGQPSDGQPIPDLPADGQPGLPGDEQSIHGPSANGQSIHGPPTNGQPVHGPPANGQSIHGPLANEQSVHGSPDNGQSVHGPPVGGQSVRGSPDDGQPAPEQHQSIQQQSASLIQAASQINQPEICAADDWEEVHIGNVHKSNTAADIQRHIKRLGVQCTREPLTLSKPSHTKKSFKVSLPKGSASTVLRADLWPTGVTLRPFRPRSHQTHSQSQSNRGAHPHRRQWGSKGNDHREPNWPRRYNNTNNYRSAERGSKATNQNRTQWEHSRSRRRNYTYQDNSRSAEWDYNDRSRWEHNAPHQAPRYQRSQGY